MAIRSTVGSMLESAIGRERTNNLRRLERRTRNALATRIAMEPVRSRPQHHRPNPRIANHDQLLGHRAGSRRIRSPNTLSRS